MKSEFKGRVTDDGKPLALKQSQIASHFSRRAAKLKKAGIDAMLKATDDDGGDDAAAHDDDDDDDDETENYNDYTCPELRKLLKARGLDDRGKKAALVARLEADDGSD